MAKQAVYDYSTTAASNTDIDGLDSTGATGLVKSGDNYARSMMAHIKGLALDLGSVNTVAGTADAIAITLSSAPSALVDGMRLTFNASAANTGATTLNVTPAGGSAFGAKKVMKWSAGSEAALSAGDIPAANALIELIYDSARDTAAGAWMLLTASTTFATNAQAVTGTSTTLATNPANLAAVMKLAIGNMPTLSNNGTDATNDIDFSAGYAADINATVGPYLAACAAMTKRLDADWSAGTGNGMRYSGAAIANTTYHLWAAWKDDGTQDYYADPSATYATVLGHLQAETGGASYTHMRRIGSIIRASAAIKAFSQNGDEFLWSTSVLDVDAANPGTSAVLRTLTVPSGVKVIALFNGGLNNNEAGSGSICVFTSPDESDQAPLLGAAPLGSAPNTIAAAGGAQYSYVQLAVRTNTSAQIRSRQSGSTANMTLRIATYGYIDTRGSL